MSPTPEPHRESVVLQVQSLSVCLGGQRVLSDVSLSVPRGKTLVVLGESGCGKTTLLRAIAGLVPIQSGLITVGDHHIGALSPEARGTVYLDQEPLLFEHLSVAENIGFAASLRGETQDQIDSQVSDLLTAIDLTTHADKREGQLSGGQRQRVAFARAILARPPVLLLDEPFGSLDGRTRLQMQSLFRVLVDRYSLTSVFVTHDIREALVVGDDFSRMSNGVLSISPSRQAFIDDPDSGVASEVRFWANIQSSDEPV